MRYNPHRGSRWNPRPDAEPVTCPRCLLTNTVRDGWRYNKPIQKQLYRCLLCNQDFSIDDMRMTIPVNYVLEASRRGKSTREIKQLLKNELGLEVSNVGVWRVIKRNKMLIIPVSRRQTWRYCHGWDTKSRT